MDIITAHTLLKTEAEIVNVGASRDKNLLLGECKWTNKPVDWKAEVSGRLSQSFFNTLDELKKPFDRLSKEPLFREIGEYEGQLRESLVLHQRAGYAKIYRIWQELKLYLDFFGSDASVSQRSVEQLYEIWCVLELKRILEQLGFKETKPLKKTQTKIYEKVLIPDDGLFCFDRSDGLSARLIHEPSYSLLKAKLNSIYSWTTTQRPDILLEVTFGDKKETARWVFDAKYRIDTDPERDWPMKDIDRTPYETINQMHRYRDSLIYLSKAEEGSGADKSRPIIGAFALYPGWFANQTEQENPYKESIDAVGIGAFPVLPGQQANWLKQFLKEKLGTTADQNDYSKLESDDLFLQESIRIAPYGLKQYRYQNLVLAVAIYKKNKPASYYEKFVTGTAQYYHMPVSRSNGSQISRHIMRELGYCAFSVLDNGGRICRYLYPVKSIHIKKRSEIDTIAGTSNPGRAHEDYWVVELGAAESIKELKSVSSRTFDIRIVDLQKFREVNNWNELPLLRYRKICDTV